MKYSDGIGAGVGDGVDECAPLSVADVGHGVDGCALSGGGGRDGVDECDRSGGSSVCVSLSPSVLASGCGFCIQATVRATTNKSEANPSTASANTTNHTNCAILPKPPVPKKPLISKTACVANCFSTGSNSSASSPTVAARTCPRTPTNTNPLGFQVLPAATLSCLSVSLPPPSW